MSAQAQALWIVGSARSGKTTRLVQQFCSWGQPPLKRPGTGQAAATSLVFAASGDNRMDLTDLIAVASQGQYALHSTTPLGFFQEEVLLFWPLLVQQLQLKARFPLRLRPETEQELATRLWQAEIDQGHFRMSGVSHYFLVRRTLDIFQLAALSGILLEDISVILQQGLGEQEQSDLWTCMGTLLQRWRRWCLERGLLTYGLIAELYGRYLLPNLAYQQTLCRRYQAVLADDVEDYPAIARHLFETLLDQNLKGAFTYNPDGASRLGLGADPQAMAVLSARCQTETLTRPSERCLADVLQQPVVTLVQDAMQLTPLPASVRSIQTTSRAQLLRQTADVITDAVTSEQVQPDEMAVVGPGLDAIAQYTLTEILTSRGIAVNSLNNPRPLVSTPIIRALLTLLALVYPGLGRLIDRDAVAEMLVLLSQLPVPAAERRGLEQVRIDPVRAGLLADYCFAPHPDRPRLLPITTFPRWDRLGFQATTAYEEITTWIEAQQLQLEQRLVPQTIAILDRAIQQFLWRGNPLAYSQLAALRELMETAQHYWDVDTRLRQHEHLATSAAATVGGFIQLLRNGTITADPYPVRSLTAPPAVTLATVFQYRTRHCVHRWQFWLDVGSNYWLTGGRGLFGAPLFLRNWSGKLWTTEDQMQTDEYRLQEQITDLLGHVTERIYLCHSDLATNGQEQTGPLLSLVNAAGQI